MSELELFTAALGLSWSWKVVDVSFLDKDDNKELHIKIDHERGANFHYDGEDYGVYDRRDRTWRHLNFFQHKTFLHAKVPLYASHSAQPRLNRSKP